jgi:sialidase-1
MKTQRCNKVLAILLCVFMLVPLVPVSGLAATAPTPVLQVEDAEITEGTVYDLTSDSAADTILNLTDGTIIIRYTSSSAQKYQSLFSVSNSTTGNENRHFHIYVTPSGALGMELRNTDSVFKYTVSASGAVTHGSENIIAFSATSTTGNYKLFANGKLVATLNKSDYKFLGDINGLNTISIGGTVRGGVVKYPFGGAVSELQVYDAALDDDALIEATKQDEADKDFSFEKDDVEISSGSVYDLTSEVPEAMTMTEGTILIRYISDSSNSIQSLFSASNSTSGNENRHFHIYVTPEGTLGFELRNTDDVLKYTDSRASAVRVSYLGQAATNTVALRADSTTKTYTLFANGQKITTLTVDDYKFIADITGVNTVSLGGTIRGGAVKYPFAGIIGKIQLTSEVLTDDQLMEETSDTTYGTLIFSDAGSVNCNYYRIPSLLTLANGTIVAAADARYGGTHDSKSNIDTAFSYSTDNGQTWSEPILPFCFDDYAAQKVDWPTSVGARDLQIQGSASFIDPVMVQDAESGRLFLFTDVMPAGVGSSNAAVGNGYKTIDGKQYLKLRWYEDESSTYNYSVRENGVIFDDTTNTATEYTVNDKFEVLKNGEPLTVKQYSVSITGSTLNEAKTDVDVAMNVFYQDSLFKVYPTAYLGMTYSDDNGLTWSSMQLLNTLKSDSEKLLITGPGAGIQIQNGEYAGRLVVPVYSVTLAGFGVIYSDDGGNSWSYSAADSTSSGATAEGQIVEMPDGSLFAYVRTSSGYVAERRSVDGGVTWSAEQAVSGVSTTSYGTQLSVIRYSGTIDGKQAIIMSTPNSSSGRNTGVIKIGLITDTGVSGVNRYSVDWKYSYEIDGSVGYSYSCLAELPNGQIGLLYEKYDSWARTQLHMKNVLPFETYTIDQLTGT